jgi:Xaa-Pro aminopeptidase
VYRVVEAAGYRNPIHIGHGIGVTNVERPRLVRGNDTVLEVGMVLMVEPGAYRAGVGGARLEQMFVLTEDGNDVLSPYAIAEDPTAA